MYNYCRFNINKRSSVCKDSYKYNSMLYIYLSNIYSDVCIT